MKSAIPIVAGLALALAPAAHVTSVALALAAGAVDGASPAAPEAVVGAVSPVVAPQAARVRPATADAVAVRNLRRLNFCRSCCDVKVILLFEP